MCAAPDTVRAWLASAIDRLDARSDWRRSSSPPGAASSTSPRDASPRTGAGQTGGALCFRLRHGFRPRRRRYTESAVMLDLAWPSVCWITTSPRPRRPSACPCCGGGRASGSAAVPSASSPIAASMLVPVVVDVASRESARRGGSGRPGRAPPTDRRRSDGPAGPLALDLQRAPPPSAAAASLGAPASVLTSSSTIVELPVDLAADDGLADAHRAGLEVDVRPAQPGRLAESAAQAEQDRPERPVAMVGDRPEQQLRLGDRERPGLVLAAFGGSTSSVTTWPTSLRRFASLSRLCRQVWTRRIVAAERPASASWS